jgi:hypothetical protein
MQEQSRLLAQYKLVLQVALAALQAVVLMALEHRLVVTEELKLTV